MQSGALIEIPRKPLVRTTGGIRLAVVVCLFLADALGHIVVGDVDLAYEALATDPSQFDLAITFALLSAFLFVVAAWGLYVLLRPVNRGLALLLLLNAIGVAIQVASYIPLPYATLSAEASCSPARSRQPRSWVFSGCRSTCRDCASSQPSSSSPRGSSRSATSCTGPASCPSSSACC